jgi:L-2-hydroxyglutarate oxidase LhgO
VNTSDFLVIGGGIVGLGIARELKSRYQDSKITIIEKESATGLHASGRNSGVLHAGFYYTADSLKARFTRDGNRLLTEYCKQKNIKLNQCGKLVVAKNESEDLMLDELMRRGKNNGVPLEMLDKSQAQSIEPKIKTLRRAIFSPTTSTADPGAVIKAVEADAKSEGIEIHFEQAYELGTNKNIKTTSDEYSAAYVVNCAGLYADHIAKQFDFSKHYAILPFKGLYLKSNEPAGTYRTNIYPVPDLDNPFLGVHFTIKVDGTAKIGPTAIPALWREQYKGLSRFQFNELTDIAIRSMGLLLKSDFDFKRIAATEILKYSRRRMVGLAKDLVQEINHKAYKEWAKPGIRAQLVDLKKRKLEMDFVLESDDQSMHVLNAVSPGWTCSIPFSAYVVDEITRSIN